MITRGNRQPELNREYMPHIVHLTTVHLPFDTRIFQKECRSLAQAGYRVSLIAPHTNRETVDGVEIIPVPRFTGRLERMSKGTWAVYRLARRLDADLYHFHDPELMPVGMLLRLTTRACVVYDVHENYPANMQSKEWLPRPLRNLASWGVELTEKVTAALADGIVTATEPIAARFSPAKTQVIKNYPLPAMMALSPAEQCKYKNNYTLIYTGGFTDHRGIHQIVQALEHVQTPQARLTLLGRAIHPYVEEAVQGLPGYRRVDYLGHVPFETMYHHLNTAAIGLVCNQPRHGYDLALPNKLFEYLSAGLPVIASHFDSWQEIVEGNQCGITVDPTDPAEIAQAIDTLLGQPELRRTMGENARQAAGEKYNWEHESQKLLNLYQEVLGRC